MRATQAHRGVAHAGSWEAIDVTATNSERSFNEALARVLWTKHPAWRERLTAEQHRAVKGGGQPDLIVRNPLGAPVVLETEYIPARTVEQDAIARLGRELADSGYAVEQCIALRAPNALQKTPQPDLDTAAAEARYEYCLFTRTDLIGHVRWPRYGWMTGGVDDLASLIENASISERVVARSLKILEDGIHHAAVRLRGATFDRPDVNASVAEALHQEDGEQTSRMAMAIIANALTFHTMLAGIHGVRTLDALRRSGVLPKAPVLQEWERILQVNYWPIFHVAREVLIPIPDGVAARLLDRLADVASELEAHGTTRSHDIYGRTFQQLIADRKFLATFYTLPESAALLAELAVGLIDVDWSEPAALTELRACDFACGTGTLITAAYHALLARHRRAGGNDAAIHREMMERSIVAADIMPAATHLTISMLSSAHPTTPFEQTQVHLLPYGRQNDSKAGFALGALDLIQKQHGMGLFENTGIEVHRGTGDATGVERDGEGSSDTFLLKHRSMDLVIMNPPFTRPTGHEAMKIGVPVPSFAGLGNDAEEQAAMSTLLKAIRREITKPAGHGNAGLASNFLDLAHAKVKPGGVLALVMPLSLLQGNAWAGSRALLRRHYQRTMIIGLAAPGRDDAKSFSADTGMGEVLVISSRLRRTRRKATAEDPVTFVALRRRPASGAEAVALAVAIRAAERERRSRVVLGDDLWGTIAPGTWDDGKCASIVHPDLVEIVRGLLTGRLTLPPQSKNTHTIPVTALRELGERGMYHADINGINKSPRHGNSSHDSFRGPFDIVPLSTDTPTYPALWGHEADRERYLAVQPDTEGLVREQCEEEADAVWQTATRLHFNRDFRLNSQSLAACLTPTRALGGTAWPNFLIKDPRDETVTVLWANTTLGLILFWWTGTTQQAGRSRLSISRLPDLLALDTRALSTRQHTLARRVFAEFEARPFLPANEAYRDTNRQALDEAVLCNLLGLPSSILDSLELLRKQWCSEPTVHGGKSTRPEPGGAGS